MLAVETASENGASEIKLIGDSELVVRQVRGNYRVKDAGLRPLHKAATDALAGLESWSIRNVPRDQNEAADALVNATLDSG